MKTAVFILCLGVAFCATAQDRNFEVRDAEDCQNLPTKFEDVASAIESISEARFIVSQNFRIRRKSGLKAGNYYSCDNQTGYLILEIDDRKVVYHDVDKAKWEALTFSSDPDYFVKQELDPRYLKIE